MNIIKTCEARLKKLTLCDIACVKIATAAGTLLLAKFFPELLTLEWHWYLVIGLAAMVRPAMKMLCK